MHEKHSLKVVLLRLFFVFTICLIFYLFWLKLNDYALFILVVFIFLLVPRFTRLLTFSDYAELKQYYLLGIIVKSYRFDRRSLSKINSFIKEIGEDSYDGLSIPDDSLWSFLPLFFPPKSTIKYYAFSCTHKGVDKVINVGLTENEYKKIESILMGRKA